MTADRVGGVRRVGGRLMVIRGVELGRRAAAGNRGRRVREEFADWELRRLKNRGGSRERGKREPGRTWEIQGGTREARELGGSWRVPGGTRRKHGD